MTLKNILPTLLLPLFVTTAGAAVIVSDNFNNGDFATAGAGNTGSGSTVYNNGTKSASETVAANAKWIPGTTADAWQRTELHSNDEISVGQLLSTTASSVQYSWTIGGVSTVRTSGTDAEYRIQLGILPNTVTQGQGAEMYVNTQGGIWFDMNILGTATGQATASLFDGNTTKTVNGDGTNRGNVTVAGWNWANTSRTFTLTLTGSGYSWSDSSGANYGGTTYATAGFSQALMATPFFGFIMGQDRDVQGKGGHTLSNFSVVAVPEAGSTALLGLAGAGALLRRRRRVA
ncbi:MAG: PEP-CTERM sorting domain-containing protein [Verrucomicrobiota bacterium]